MKQSNSLDKNFEFINELKRKSKPNVYYKKQQNIFSLKPPKYNIQKDINIYDIYQIMIKEVDLIFPAMPKKVDLNQNERKLRKDIISQMRHFLHNYRLNELCLFHSIYLMDKLLAKKIKLNITEVAIACLFISVKFINNDGDIPPINNFLEILTNNQKISIKELMLLEIECLKKLNYKISTPQPINFINLMLMNGIVFNTDVEESKIKLNSSIYNLPIEIYYDIIYVNTDYLQFHPLYIAFTCIAMARELVQLDKWGPFNKVFNITFSEFEEVYQFIFDLYMEYQEKKKMKEEIVKREINESVKISKNNIMNSQEKNNKINTLKEKNILKQDDKNKYTVKSEKKVDSMKKPIDIKSLRHYYISKTKSSKINLEQLDFLFKGKGENKKESKELIKQNSKNDLKKNLFQNLKQNSAHQKIKSIDLIKEMKGNQSFNNYFQQIKSELPNSSRDNKKTIENENNQNKLKEDKIIDNIFYYTIKRKSDLGNYSTLKTLNSTSSKTRNFLKNEKNYSQTLLINPLNNSSFNQKSFQNLNNSKANKKTCNNNNNIDIKFSKKIEYIGKSYQNLK